MDGFPGRKWGVGALDHAREGDTVPQQTAHMTVTLARDVTELVVAMEDPDGKSIVRVGWLGTELQGYTGLERFMQVRALVILEAGDGEIIHQHAAGGRIGPGSSVTAEQQRRRNEREFDEGGEEVSPGVVWNLSFYRHPF